MYEAKHKQCVAHLVAGQAGDGIADCLHGSLHIRLDHDGQLPLVQAISAISLLQGFVQKLDRAT